MMRSLFAGVSGLKNHQLKMDVLGNNISNVNTAGFKASRASFAEMFSQTLQGATAPSDARGGTNAQQVGLGSSLSSIDVLHTQGNLQSTGGVTDMALEGQGFFIVRDAGQMAYTRAGTFQPDADGYLVTPTGLRVQGWRATEGELPRTDSTNLDDLCIPLGEAIGASTTTRVVYHNNLNSASDEGYEWTTPVEIFDSQGRQHSIEVTFARCEDEANTWHWSVDTPDGEIDDQGTILFDEGGLLVEGDEGTVSLELEGAEDIDLVLDFSSITQFYGSTTVAAAERDGYPMGTLENFTIDSGGEITGVYSNGRTQTLGQVAVAAFSNPAGLIVEAGNVFRESNNSGMKQVGPPGTASRGTIAAGTLEMSNVDLSEQFVEMIVTQRGFQANSRIISTSDEMLQELVNLKR